MYTYDIYICITYIQIHIHMCINMYIYTYMYTDQFFFAYLLLQWLQDKHGCHTFANMSPKPCGYKEYQRTIWSDSPWGWWSETAALRCSFHLNRTVHCSHLTRVGYKTPILKVRKTQPSFSFQCPGLTSFTSTVQIAREGLGDDTPYGCPWWTWSRGTTCDVHSLYYRPDSTTKY